MNLKRLAVDVLSFRFGKHEVSVGARFSHFNCKFVRENGLCSSEKHMKSSSWNVKFLVKIDLETFGSVFRLRESLRNVLKCKAFQVSSITGFGSAVENHVLLFF